MTTCPAALNIKGEHFNCDLDAPHFPLGHSNRDAEALWIDDRNAARAALGSEDTS